MAWNGSLLTATTSSTNPYVLNAGVQLRYAGFQIGAGRAEIRDRRYDSSPVAGPAFGDDRFTGLSLGGKYILGPGVNLDGVLFHVEFDGNGSTAPTSSHSATGGVVGLLLTF